MSFAPEENVDEWRASPKSSAYCRQAIAMPRGVLPIGNSRAQKAARIAVRQ